MSPLSFSTLPEVQPDAIFKIAAEAKAAGPEAINGTVGMLLDDDGSTVLLPSVRMAMQMERRGELPDFGYPLLTGLPSYRTAVHTLLGNHEHTASVATVGGTGAVSVNLRLLQRMNPGTKLMLPTPTWANHAELCKEAGIETETVPYLENGKPSIGPIVDRIKTGTYAVLLHGTCHNPSGLDVSDDQWQELAAEMSKHGSAALVDLAYQGFAQEPEKDAQPISILKEQGVPTLVAWSASKNHSIYSERVGLAAAMTDSELMRTKLDKTYAKIVRAIHSASATYGQRIVALVQEQLQKPWQEDLAAVRVLLQTKRTRLAEELPPEFTDALSGNGMFALLPLCTEEIAELKSQKIFLATDGRINIGGIPLSRISELAQKMRRVIA